MDPIQPDNSNLSKDDIYDLLADEKPAVDQTTKEDEVVEPKKEPKAPKEIELEEGEEEQEPEVKLEDDEEPEPDEEDLELVVPARKREILAKYPSLFKDFPYLERAYYVDRQYTELFGTIADAKQVIERAGILSNFEEQLQSGNTENILKTVKDADPNAFAKLVDEYLPNLAKVDQNAYYHIVGNISKKTILSMAQEGARLNNDHLKNAALVLNQFVFGNSQFEPEAKFSKAPPEDNKEKQQLQTDRQNFAREKFEAVRDDLSTKATNVLKSTVDAHIDPKGVMSSYVKRNAIKDCLSNLEEVIGQDRHFRAVLDKMWQKAAEENFSQQSLGKIRSAYLSKAKTYLPTAIQKARNEALKGPGKGDNGEQKDKRGPITPGRSASPNKSGNDTKTIPKGMKTFDFLNQD